jgi:1-acyl-sn-glycerol-3-phosphate acyltransferase
LRFYRFCRGLVNIFLRTYFRMSVEGAEHIPTEGGFVLAGNHMSYLDPFVMGVGCSRQVYFMAKAEIFKIPVIKQVAVRLGAFPVRRGGADRQAIRKGLDILMRGDVLGVFPEGTRNRSDTGELLTPQGGAAMLALKADVPVVPAAIWGTDRVDGWLHFPKPVRIGVRFGAPIYFTKVDKVNHEIVASASARIIEAIEAMIPKRKKR